MAVLAVLAVVSLRDGSGHSPPPGVTQTVDGAAGGPDPTTQARLDARRRIPGDPLALVFCFVVSVTVLTVTTQFSSRGAALGPVRW